MNGLLKMEPKERLTAREALCHSVFDGLRSENDEMQAREFRATSALKRQESAGGGNRNESSRSRSGLRNQVKAPLG